MVDESKTLRDRIHAFALHADAHPRMNFVVLGALFLLLLVQPVADSIPFGGMVMKVVFTGIMLLALAAVSNRPALLMVGVVLAAPSTILPLVDRVGPYTVITADLASIGLFFFIIVVFLLRILSHRVVTGSTVAGAVSVYLLMAVTWAAIYAALETFQPCSFNGLLCDPDAVPGGALARGAQEALLYYSLVTISTLGYGDISPATDVARTAAAMEAVVGQLFLVVLVARLVGLISAQKSDDPEGADSP